MPDPRLPRALAIVGPTGTGKSAFALRLAAELPVEIVSVDSAQVYRGLDIGTAKPTPAEQSAVPHHLIDLRDPDGNYSAGEFRADCLQQIGAIAARGRLPLLVGGTMLYYRALFRGIAALPPRDPALRAHLDRRAAEAGWPALHAELARADPAAAARIHPNDAQRIQRALEILTLGGRTLDAAWDAADPPPDFADWLVVTLVPASRERLHERLAGRLQAMLEAGFVEEVRALHAAGRLRAGSVASRTVGYRQLLSYCDGVLSRDAACREALHATRQLAKRQLTWLRGDALLPVRAGRIAIDPFEDGAYERFRAAALQWSITAGVRRP